MKKMGFCGVAVATTFMGEVTLDLSVGFDTVRGKSFDPLGSGGVQVEVGGSHAGGAGSLLVLGDHVIGTGGVDGYEGEEGGVGGVGGGVVVLVGVLEFVPQATRVTLRRTRKENFQADEERTPGTTVRIDGTTSTDWFASRRNSDRSGEPFERN